MPAVSKAQQRLMAAAEHGATFSKAKEVRQSMTHQQMRDFATTPRTGLPAHVKTAGHPHRNLGAYLHPKKGR